MEIFTYGSGKFIASILEAVKMFNSGGTITSLLKVFLLVAFLSGLASVVLRGLSRFGLGASEVGGGDEGILSISPILILIRNAFVAAICVYVFLSPFFVTDVIVEDRYDPTQSQIVTEVPYGIAFIGYASSVIGDRMGEVIEEYITPVEAVRFRTGGGVGIGPKYINELFELLPPGSEMEYSVSSSNVPTRGVLEAWFSECIYPNFALIEGEGIRAEGLNAFSRSGFILGDPAFMVPPFYDPNTPLSVQYYGYPDANETTCANAVSQITSRWYNNGLFEKWIARFSARSFGTKEDDPTVVMRIYDMVDRYFPDPSLGSQDKLIQLATLNTAYSAYLKLSAEYGSTGASDLARRKQTSSWIEMARMGTRALFLIRQVAEAAVYLFGVFLPVFIAIGGLSVLTKYVKAVFWLQLWIPVFAVLNAIADYHLLKVVESVSYCTGGVCSLPLNFETVDKLRTETGMILGYMGLLSVSAPGIAWGIMQGASSLGSMATSVVASHEAGATASAATTQRVGSLAGYTAGTMLASAEQAGIGQAMSAGHLQVAGKYGLGEVQNLAEVELGHGINVRRPTMTGEIAEAQNVGAPALEQAGAIGIAASVGGARGAIDTFNAAKKQGLLPENATFEDYFGAKASVATMSTQMGMVTVAANKDHGFVYSAMKGGTITEIKGARDLDYGGMRFSNVNYLADGSNVKLESQTRDTALLGQLAQKADKLNLPHAAKDLREMQTEIGKNKGSSANVLVEGDMNGNISNIKVGRGGEVNETDLGKNISGGVRQRLDIDKTTYDHRDTHATGSNTISGHSVEGPYRGADGKWYDGKFQYIETPKGKVMVAGEGTNVQNYTVAGTVTTPDGKTVPVVTQISSGPDGQILRKRASGGDSLVHDDKQTFRGGYEYDNYVAAYAREKFGDRWGQAAGKSKGIIKDVGSIVGGISGTKQGVGDITHGIEKLFKPKMPGK